MRLDYYVICHPHSSVARVLKRYFKLFLVYGQAWLYHF